MKNYVGPAKFLSFMVNFFIIFFKGESKDIRAHVRRRRKGDRERNEKHAH